MLDGLKEVITRLNIFYFEETIQQLLSENADGIVLRVKKQMASGLDGDDKSVTLYGKLTYAQKTINIKKQFGDEIGGITSYITNYMTGEFYDSLYFKLYKGDNFAVDANSPLTDEIIERSGEKILYLNNENLKSLYEDVILPAILEQVSNIFYVN